MANVAHSTLTTSNLHEPKGTAAATSGQVYIANGAGSGAWTTVAGLTITGMVSAFATPLAPSGWLECNGSAINTTTFSALYNAMSIQQTGSRTGGSAIITGLAATSNIKVGYYVFGTGVTSGTTVLSIDSATQITMSASSASTGSATVIVSPWLLNTGTISLPNMTSTGCFPRSRASATKIGDVQSNTVINHVHAFSGSTSSDGTHGHPININDPGHRHSIFSLDSNHNAAGGSVNSWLNAGAHLHLTEFSGTGISASTVDSGAHGHSYSGSTGNPTLNGGTETRPEAIVLMYCVKT